MAVPVIHGIPLALTLHRNDRSGFGFLRKCEGTLVYEHNPLQSEELKNTSNPMVMPVTHGIPLPLRSIGMTEVALVF